jgi:hypothetical protein
MWRVVGGKKRMEGGRDRCNFKFTCRYYTVLVQCWIDTTSKLGLGGEGWGRNYSVR